MGMGCEHTYNINDLFKIVYHFFKGTLPAPAFWQLSPHLAISTEGYIPFSYKEFSRVQRTHYIVPVEMFGDILGRCVCVCV